MTMEDNQNYTFPRDFHYYKIIDNSCHIPRKKNSPIRSEGMQYQIGSYEVQCAIIGQYPYTPHYVHT